LTFFGVRAEGGIFKKNVLSEIFALNYYTSISYLEAYNMPVSRRKWCFQELIKYREKAQPDLEGK